MRTLLRSFVLVRRYFTSIFFRIVLIIVRAHMGLYAVLCCNCTVTLCCVVRLSFKVNVLCNHISSLDDK